ASGLYYLPLLPCHPTGDRMRYILFIMSFFYHTYSSVSTTLSLHDALPISCRRRAATRSRPAPPVRSAPAGRGSRRSTNRRGQHRDRKSTRLNSSHVKISYAVFCLKKKTIIMHDRQPRNRRNSRHFAPGPLK